MNFSNSLYFLLFLAVSAAATLGCSSSDPTTSTTGDLLGADGHEEKGDDGPGNGTCSDASGEFLYSTSRYEGGAPPPPDLVVSERKLVYHGEVVGHTQTRASGESEDLHRWEVRLRFDASSKQVLASTGTDFVGSTTYVQKVTGTLVMGLGPTIESNTFTKLVICQDNWNSMMP